MIGLTAAMAACGMVFVAALVMHHRSQRGDVRSKLPFMAGLAAAVLVLSAALFGGISAGAFYGVSQLFPQESDVVAAESLSSSLS